MSKTIHWHPQASLETLRKRAKILAQIRNFFATRNILEVETPLLCHASVTDPYIESITAFNSTQSKLRTEQFYLQTSPEYAMKRLLAAGSGAIYQICKAFRCDEVGRNHHPEFSILEWYRPGFDHHQLMDEVETFLQCILHTRHADRFSYTNLFKQYLDIDVHATCVAELKTAAQAYAINIHDEVNDKDSWLQLLLDPIIEKLSQNKPIFIYDFPESQAALARINTSIPKTAARFEVYLHGLELANGFHELQDAKLQRDRFEKNNIHRQQLNQPIMPIDEFLLAALAHGLPNCAGVAVGIDRLVMIATQKNSINEVLSFNIQNI